MLHRIVNTKYLLMPYSPRWPTIDIMYIIPIHSSLHYFLLSFTVGIYFIL